MLGNKFLTHWLIYNIIAFAIGIIFSFIVADIFGIVFPSALYLIDGVCVGLCVGFFQWHMLQKYIKVNYWWGLASTLGLGLPFTLILFLDIVGLAVPLLAGKEVLTFSFIGFLGGMISGLIQLRILRKHLSTATWWVPLCIVSWTIAWYVSSCLNSLIGLSGVVMGGIPLAILEGSGFYIMNKSAVATIESRRGKYRKHRHKKARNEASAA